jgi:hypothetical protein
MNAKQIKRLQTVTQQKWIEWKAGKFIDGALSFSAFEIDGKVFIHASNTSTIEWYQRQIIVQMHIGPRGGLNEFKIIY